MMQLGIDAIAVTVTSCAVHDQIHGVGIPSCHSLHSAAASGAINVMVDKLLETPEPRRTILHHAVNVVPRPIRLGLITIVVAGCIALLEEAWIAHQLH